MGVPNVAFTWRSLKVLRAIVSTMNIIGLIVVFTAIVWAIKLRRDIGEYLNLAVPGDGHLWPTVIIVAAVPCAPVYLLGLKAYLCLPLANSKRKSQEDRNGSDDDPNSEHSFENTDDDNDDDSDGDSDDDDNDENDETNKGRETNRILFLHAILCLLSGCLVAAINVACFLKSSTFQDKINDDGLMEAMENYSSDEVARSRVDAIQLEFQCCGNEDYRDWFRVSWFKQSVEYFDYVEDERRQEAEDNEDHGGSRVEDVPFSCCTNKIIEPCGPHEVLRASAVCNFYASKDGAVWNVGCRSVIVTHARVLGSFLILFLIFLTIYQFVLCVLSRFLQTAYSNELHIGPEMDHYRGWIFNGISNPCTKYHGNVSEESDEDDEETAETRSPIKETPPLSIVCLNDKNDDKNPIVRKKHEFLLTTRGSVRPIEVDRLRKAKSNPVFYQNGIVDKHVRKSKVKLDYYQALPTNEPYQEQRKQSDKKIFIERSDKSMKTSSRSRERLSSKKSDVPSAPLPPPFPPQSDEYDGERNLVNEGFKIDESSSTKLRYTFVANNESGEQKVEEETSSKPSKQDRRKLLEKFEKVLGMEERRESGGADIPRPWERLVQRSVDSNEKNRDFDDGETSPRANKKSHVLSRFRSADAYDRFRGTLQDTLSRRRENLKEPTNPISRPTQPRMCPCCMKHNRNFGRPSRCKVQRTPPGYPVDPEDPGIVHRQTLLPDIPCPLPPPPVRANPCSSACYPRPTLIRQQQQEQRRQRQWNFRQNLTNDQPPPWTLPASFSRPLTSKVNPDDDRRICCHAKTLCNTHERCSTFKRDDSIRKYRYRMD